MDIWKSPLEIGQPIQLTNTSFNETHPAWSPDGKTIAYGIGNRSIGLYNIEKDKSSEFADVGFRCFPVWTPDGEWIMVNWQNTHFYNLNDKSNFKFSPPDKVGNFFSWSPDGKKMLFFRTSYFYNQGLKIGGNGFLYSRCPVH